MIEKRSRGRRKRKRWGKKVGGRGRKNERIKLQRQAVGSRKSTMSMKEEENYVNECKKFRITRKWKKNRKGKQTNRRKRKM